MLDDCKSVFAGMTAVADGLFLDRLALSAAWHGFHAAVGGRVVAKASWVKVLIDPVTSTRVIVLRPSRSTPA